MAEYSFLSKLAEEVYKGKGLSVHSEIRSIISENSPGRSESFGEPFAESAGREYSFTR